MRAALATVLLLGVSLTAFVSSRDGTALGGTASTNPAPTHVVVTGGDSDAPSRCRPGRLGLRMVRFNAALNDADGGELRRFWKEKRGGLRSGSGASGKRDV
jgi:hypothetical protein